MACTTTGWGGGYNPAKPELSLRLYETSDTAVIGNLAWQVREITSGTMLDKGTSVIRACDVQIVKDGSDYYKRLTLGSSFYLKLEFHGNEQSGFAINAARDGEDTFSWEWFEQDGKGGAKKLQEGGRLEVTTQKVGVRGDMIRTSFLTDVNLRIQPKPSLFTALLRIQAYQVHIAEGSDIKWPILEDGALKFPSR